MKARPSNVMRRAAILICLCAALAMLLANSRVPYFFLSSSQFNWTVQKIANVSGSATTFRQILTRQGFVLQSPQNPQPLIREVSDCDIRKGNVTYRVGKQYDTCVDRVHKALTETLGFDPAPHIKAFHFGGIANSPRLIWVCERNMTVHWIEKSSKIFRIRARTSFTCP
jgi:hypothetical protein